MRLCILVRWEIVVPFLDITCIVMLFFRTLLPLRYTWIKILTDQNGSFALSIIR